ncbi:hypothetical protein EJ04DRAFT_431724 [Polyplosphaeria fusca]|uniref:CST complex subunit STN1 n=1 Tax=Polyplosphaeria fusca TaxID=682080 RepID=A0A9P4V559_9PLEO|nr:hypothetical protein EJ04DRAFT_431724 [Polyplosphaeria fusca]
MSTTTPVPSYRLFPAYCFEASPTYNAWVKLFVADVHALRSEPDFATQKIYFFLNHPVRFVCVVGAVVAIDDINTKYTILTIDDGSGATVEVKIVRLTPDTYNPVEFPSNTVVDNVHVVSRLGVFEVTVNHQPLDIGTVIKAKCTISEFRSQKQLELKRVWIVRTTNEEAEAWAETAAWKKQVLSTPWRLTSREHKQITDGINSKKQKAQQEEQLRAERDFKSKERRKARGERMAAREIKLESRRRKEELMMNAGSLI